MITTDTRRPARPARGAHASSRRTSPPTSAASWSASAWRGAPCGVRGEGRGARGEGGCSTCLEPLGPPRDGAGQGRGARGAGRARLGGALGVDADAILGARGADEAAPALDARDGSVDELLQHGGREDRGLVGRRAHERAVAHKLLGHARRHVTVQPRLPRAPRAPRRTPPPRGARSCAAPREEGGVIMAPRAGR